MKLTPDTTAIVIGGGGGIGRGTALGLASRGVRCVIADIELDSAQAVAAELVAGGTDALAVRVDATDVDSLAELAERAEARFGPVHVLSNNVGVIVDVPLLEATEQQWGWVVEFNLMTIVRACSVIVPRIRAHGGGGHVVNTASMAALFASTPQQVGGVRLGLYTTTKHAILGYSETLRGELAPDGIGVSCLCPGMVDSNLLATSLRNRPERYGGAEQAGDTTGLIPGAMAQEDVGPYVVAGIEGDRLHILTHPGESRAIVEARAAALAADLDHYDEVARRGEA
jgi:NAD(P)-dependent dehydrogenase (short-subunit alcohol dehydrogenase family)